MSKLENNKIVTFCKTKAGKGYKIVLPNGVWLYTSKGELHKVLNNLSGACIFRSIEDDKQEAQQEVTRLDLRRLECEAEIKQEREANL